MFLSIIKKEFKQFFRSPGNVFMLFAFPIILITTLSVGLNDMMNMNDSNIFGEEGKKDVVYYSIESENSPYEQGLLAFIDGIEKELDVKFKEVSNLEEVKSKVDDKKALLYIEVNKEGYELYSSKNGEELNTQIIRSVFENVLNEYATYNTIASLNPEALTSLVDNQYKEYVEKVDSKGRNVTAAEYYTFAELALIILYISITVGESVFNENLLRTGDRIKLSKVKESSLVTAKIVFGGIIGIFQTLLIYAYTSLVLDVNWGENTIKFIALFIVFGLFSSIIGAVVGSLGKKETTVSGVLNVVIVIICIFGGCYTPLSMIISIPVIDKLIYISPIYWINTATSSMICGYDSSAYIIALLIPIILSIIGISIYLGICKKKGGLQNA